MDNSARQRLRNIWRVYAIFTSSKSLKTKRNLQNKLWQNAKSVTLFFKIIKSLNHTHVYINSTIKNYNNIHYRLLDLFVGAYVTPTL